MVLIVPFIIIFSDLKFLQSSLVISIIYGMILLGIIFTVMMRIMYLAMYQYMGNRAVDNIEKLYGEIEYEYSVGMGSVRIFGESFSGFGKHGRKNKNSEVNMKIKCEAGKVSIR